jgi:glycosyltransferase involved in cell wall biosynthesis
MPAYNSAQYIGQAIKSILNQTYKDFEFMIIDDGSTDNTFEVVSSFKDSRIIYHKTGHKGTAAALNYGVNNATGDWIARIDADDLNTEDRLAKQVDFIGKNPKYNIISSWAVFFNDKGKILFLLREPVEHRAIYESLDLHNPLNQSALFFKKSLIKKAKFNDKYLFNEDYELLYRIRDQAVFYNIPEFLVYTRVRKNSKSFGRYEADHNVYEFLYNNAFKSLLNSKSKGEHYYWSNVIAWINFFYGNKNHSRKFFSNAITLKNTVAFIMTLLPKKLFYMILNSRIKYRIKSLTENKKEYFIVLKKLLK